MPATTTTTTTKPKRKRTARHKTPDRESLAQILAGRLAAAGFDVPAASVEDWFAAAQSEAMVFLDRLDTDPDTPVPDFLQEYSPAEPSATSRMIEVARIKVSPFQPRTDFDAGELQQLGESLRADGQLSDLVVRIAPGYHGKGKEYFELIGGERRWRAAQLVGIAELRARVLTIDDASARKLAMLDNLHRVDLSPVEKARGCRELLNAGVYSNQKELAAAVGIKPASLSNQLRVLDLPTEWLDRVSQEIYGLTLTHLRSLVPWIDRPEFLDAIWKNLKQNSQFHDRDSWRISVDGFGNIAARAIMEITRPLSGTEYIRSTNGGKYVSIRLTKKQKEDPALDVITLKVDGHNEKRAVNVALWTEYQTAGEQRAAARQGKSSGSGKKSSSGPGAPSPAELQAKAQAAAEARDKKLYRWKIATLQRRICGELLSLATEGPHYLGDEIEARLPAIITSHLMWFCTRSDSTSAERRCEELAAAIADAGGQPAHTKDRYGRQQLQLFESMATLTTDSTPAVLRVLAAWWNHEFEGYHRDVTPDSIERVAVQLEIQIAGDQWELEREFLELLTIADLQALAAEWKHTIESKGKSAIITELLAHCSERPAPKLITKLKPVEL